MKPKKQSAKQRFANPKAKTTQGYPIVAYHKDKNQVKVQTPWTKKYDVIFTKLIIANPKAKIAQTKLMLE